MYILNWINVMTFYIYSISDVFLYKDIDLDFDFRWDGSYNA